MTAPEHAQHYRLGIDLGATSIGWAMIRLDGTKQPDGIIAMGSRIFSDGREPKGHTSLAAERRAARLARRQRDRRVWRRNRVFDHLKRAGLVPKDENEQKQQSCMAPLPLRAKALDQPLTAYELGRALFHLNQRRGFQSNRKGGTEDEKEKKLTYQAIAELTLRMAEGGSRTYGEYLYRRELKGKKTRNLRPSRAMLEQEFDQLHECQSQHHPMDTAWWKTLRQEIFYQRPLREPAVGRCEFFPDEPRAPWSDPSAQRFRMVQEVNNLRIDYPHGESRILTDKERIIALNLLEKGKKVTFIGMKKKMGLPDDCRFNLESTKRTDLDGDANGVRLRYKGCFGKDWDRLPKERRDSIVRTLMGDHDEQAIRQRAHEENWNLSEEALANVARLELVEGYARLSLKAIALLLPVMERPDGLPYGKALDAVLAIDGEAVTLRNLSGRSRAENLDRLPYYGEVLTSAVVVDANRSGQSEVEEKWGRVNNPTVHIALNQLRKLVNTIIKRWGKPEAIVVETTRELKLGYQRVGEIEREQNQRRNDNVRIDQALTTFGIKPNRDNRVRYRLWEELGDVSNRRCPYSGKSIAANQLFTDAIEVDHILPFSRSLDDSYLNLTLCHAEANRHKRERPPWEWWEEERDSRYDIEAIQRRVQASLMSDSKKRRFGPHGAKMLADDREFLARHLNDTAYITRLARDYLSSLYPANRVQVWGSPGRLTALLRDKWRLNRILHDRNVKFRNDHRHHALDAFVVGLISQGLLQEMSRLNALGMVDDARIQVQEPWNGFFEELRTHIQGIIVSHKPDHGISRGANRGTSGQLHEETAYGIVGKTEKEEWLVCIRKNLTKFKALKDLHVIRDHTLKGRIEAFVHQRMDAGENFTTALSEFGQKNNVHSIRVLEKKDSIILVGKKPDGTPLKGYVGGSNHAIEIFALPNGRWGGEVITTFAANQKNFQPDWPEKRPRSSLVMRLAKNDLVAMGHGEKRRIMRVVKFTLKGNVVFADHYESGPLEDRNENGDDTFEYFNSSPNPMKKHQIRRVGVDIIGRLIDPGF